MPSASGLPSRCQATWSGARAAAGLRRMRQHLLQMRRFQQREWRFAQDLVHRRGRVNAIGEHKCSVALAATRLVGLQAGSGTAGLQAVLVTLLKP
ncbi:hypothetical protein [Xanthomonas citri]|uniref:hypothetical protein n=1 Tax=Xanthomonas citri TaxID=346 RepID=UPI001E466496|nr:hypothetical protein [Xanthomonas citri]